MNENKAFEYEYNAATQEEIKRIRKKYMEETEEEINLDRLRRLDAIPEQKASAVSLFVGITGMLLFGAGLSCCLLWADTLFTFGILIGLIGLAGIAAGYPLFEHIKKREQKRLAPEILKLTDELLQ